MLVSLIGNAISVGFRYRAVRNVFQIWDERKEVQSAIDLEKKVSDETNEDSRNNSNSNSGNQSQKKKVKQNIKSLASIIPMGSMNETGQRHSLPL